MTPDDAYSTNFLDSAKIAQKCVYFGFLISSAVLLVIDSSKTATVVTFLGFDMKLQSPEATVSLTALHFLNSLLISFSIRNAVQNRTKITDSDIRLALSHYPLALASSGLYGFVVIFGLCGVNMIMFVEGFDLAWYIGLPISALISLGYIDAYNYARKHLSHS